MKLRVSCVRIPQGEIKIKWTVGSQRWKEGQCAVGEWWVLLRLASHPPYTFTRTNTAPFWPFPINFFCWIFKFIERDEICFLLNIDSEAYTLLTTPPHPLLLFLCLLIASNCLCIWKEPHKQEEGFHFPLSHALFFSSFSLFSNH